ncbi:hypothetical protein HK405_015665 [Cladochytrium tenue]|nr:hypothetical protein HK405_015665 [Cladochytrium tenue]
MVSTATVLGSGGLGVLSSAPAAPAGCAPPAPSTLAALRTHSPLSAATAVSTTRATAASPRHVPTAQPPPTLRSALQHRALVMRLLPLLLCGAAGVRAAVLDRTHYAVATSTTSGSGVLIQSFGFIEGGQANLSLSSIRVPADAPLSLNESNSVLANVFIGVCADSVHDVDDDISGGTFNATYCGSAYSLPSSLAGCVVAWSFADSLLSNNTWAAVLASEDVDSTSAYFDLTIASIPTTDTYHFFVANCYFDNSAAHF